MTATLPYQGHFTESEFGREHNFALRVYYEDTDFSGVVYHARYLHFLERARSDMLSLAGITQRAAYEAGEGAYAITAMTLQFQQAARFDDALLVSSRIEKIRAAGLEIRQSIHRGDMPILAATVEAAFVSPSGRARRQPQSWIAAYRAILAHPANPIRQGQETI